MFSISFDNFSRMLTLTTELSHCGITIPQDFDMQKFVNTLVALPIRSIGPMTGMERWAKDVTSVDGMTNWRDVCACYADDGMQMVYKGGQDKLMAQRLDAADGQFVYFFYAKVEGEETTQQELFIVPIESVTTMLTPKKKGRIVDLLAKAEK